MGFLLALGLFKTHKHKVFQKNVNLPAPFFRSFCEEKIPMITIGYYPVQRGVTAIRVCPEGGI